VGRDKLTERVEIKRREKTREDGGRRRRRRSAQKKTKTHIVMLGAKNVFT
jgi:hypothetical protein